MTNLENGRSIFTGSTKHKVSCFRCHGDFAQGTFVAPPLVGYFTENSINEFKNALKEGPGYMPSYKDEFTEKEILDLKAWLESLSL